MGLYHDDPGLQPERTALSWGRTAMAMALVSMVLLRWAAVYGGWVFVLIGVLLTLSSAIYFTQRRRYRGGVRGLLENAARPNLGSVIAVTAGMLILGAGGLILVLSA